MTTVYVLDVPEFAPLAEAAITDGPLRRSRVGGYLKLMADGEITIARDGKRFIDAVWYSVLGGGFDGHLVQFDAEQIRIAPVNR